MTEQSQEYIVVMRTLSGPSTGILTWSAYQSKEIFKKWYSGKMQDGSNEPISDVYGIAAEGVTQEQAIRFIRGVPLEVRLQAAVNEANEAPTPEEREAILEMKLETLSCLYPQMQVKANPN